MSSFGTVVDLLDDRCLQLQDVIGNVKPLPTLIPYEEYTQNVFVYRMDTNHDIFMGLIQDFTMRRAHETHKELWTWLVQWEVDSPSSQLPSSPKKARVDAQHKKRLFKEPSTPRKAPALTIFERRSLDGTLLLEDNILRLLIDIVQAGSAFLPNFIEFLYRWVDYYEGDGKALKAALKWEIPSLWDFEYHPRVLSCEEMAGNDEGKGTATDGNLERGARYATNSYIAELRQSSPTKKMHTRPKPDVAAFELQTLQAEESERLQYREVKFGIQPPKLEKPLLPLMNLPVDEQKRRKYYAACFKSRQRALALLLEAGMTMRQISNYRKLQTMHPKDTPEEGDNNGLRNYFKDAEYAQTQFEMREKQSKQREIAISNKLAVEAQLAASHAIPDGAGLPLIPPTPSYTRKSDMAATMLRRIQEARARKEERINIVPKPLVGRMKSKVFEDAKADPPLIPLRGLWTGNGWQMPQPQGSLHLPSAYRNEVDGDIEIRRELNGEMSSWIDENSALSPPRPPPEYFSSTDLDSEPDQQDLNGPSTSTARSSEPAPASDRLSTAQIEDYIRNMNVEQAQRLAPLFHAYAPHAAASLFQERARRQALTERPAILPQVGPVSPPSSSQTSNSSNPYVFSTSPESPRVRQSPMVPSHSQESETAREVSASQEAALSPSISLAGASYQIQRQWAQTQLALLPRSSTLSPSHTYTTPTSSQQSTNVEGGNRLPVYDFTSGAESVMTSVQPGNLNPGSLDLLADQFRYPHRQREAPQPTTTVNAQAGSARPALVSIQSAPQLRPAASTDLHQQTLTQPHRMLSADFAANVQALNTAGEAIYPHQQLSRTPRFLQPADTFQDRQTSDESQHLPDPSLPMPSSRPASLQQLADRPPTLQSVSRLRALHNLPPIPTRATTPEPPLSNTLHPPPRPGITRNAPSPLSLSPSNPIPHSPLSTFAPQVLATSPFLDQSHTTKTPIQIYLPKILLQNNASTATSNPMIGNSEYITTDALMLGFEDPTTGALVLSKAILLQVGVWENTIRKVRSGRWSVVETYACLPSHPGIGKGKGRADESATGGGCHRAVYKKLALAYGMMSSEPVVREDELTKRWRVTPGPMTSCARGAVWEGWGAIVDKGIEMSAVEREGALRSEVETSYVKGDDGGAGVGYGPYSDGHEAERRRKEVDDLMGEDGEMDRQT